MFDLELEWTMGVGGGGRMIYSLSHRTPLLILGRRPPLGKVLLIIYRLREVSGILVVSPSKLSLIPQQPGAHQLMNYIFTCTTIYGPLDPHRGHNIFYDPPLLAASR